MKIEKSQAALQCPHWHVMRDNTEFYQSKWPICKRISCTRKKLLKAIYTDLTGYPSELLIRDKFSWKSGSKSLQTFSQHNFDPTSWCRMYECPWVVWVYEMNSLRSLSVKLWIWTRLKHVIDMLYIWIVPWVTHLFQNGPIKAICIKNGAWAWGMGIFPWLSVLQNFILFKCFLFIQRKF